MKQTAIRSVPILRIVTLVAIAAYLLVPALALAQTQPSSPPSPPPAYEDDGFDGFILLVLLLLLAVVLVLIGIGIAMAFICAVIGGLLLLFGIFTSSALVGLITRRPASAFKAMFLQIGAVAGAIAGAGVGWLTSLFPNTPAPGYVWILLGGASGLGVGTGLAMLFNIVWSRLLDRIVAYFRRKKEGAAPTSAPAKS